MKTLDRRLRRLESTFLPEQNAEIQQMIEQLKARRRRWEEQSHPPRPRENSPHTQRYVEVLTRAIEGIYAKKRGA